MQKLFFTLAAASCLVTGVSVASFAQSNPGLTLFSGVENRSDILNYHLDFGGRAGGWDRYRLRISSKKMELNVAQFAIKYPDYYDGKFDTDDIEVNYGSDYDNSAPIQEVVWDKETHLLQIYLAEPVPADNKVEIKLSNVKNPRFGGTFYFHAQALSEGDVPLPRYMGTWIIGIGR